MQQISGWPDGAPETGLNYFRGSEVVLLLVPPRRQRNVAPAVATRGRPGPRAYVQNLVDRAKAKIPPFRTNITSSNMEPERADLQGFITDLFKRGNVPVDPKSFAKERDQALQRLPRRDGLLLVERVTLAGAPPPETHNVRLLAPSMRAVVDAVSRLNALPTSERVSKQGHRFVTASPNWLAMPCHY
jgi:hypothetical protein